VVATGRVYEDGKRLSPRHLALIKDAFRAAEIPLSLLRVAQGSFSNGSLSAGTHSGAGAVDLGVYGISLAKQLRLIQELRKRNCAAWIRSRRYGGWTKGDHIHSILKDERGLAYGAAAQVRDYNAGRNGLSGGNRDYHARPKQTHFRPVYYSQIGLGKRNRSVRWVQLALRATVAPGLVVDGRWGPSTVRAWAKAIAKYRLRGLNLLRHLGELYGFLGLP
jgi:hypothetical protein